METLIVPPRLDVYNELCCEPLVGASYLHRAATTNYLCCVPTLEDSKGAGRARLARLSGCKGNKKYAQVGI